MILAQQSEGPMFASRLQEVRPRSLQFPQDPVPQLKATFCGEYDDLYRRGGLEQESASYGKSSTGEVTINRLMFRGLTSITLFNSERKIDVVTLQDRHGQQFNASHEMDRAGVGLGWYRKGFKLQGSFIGVEGLHPDVSLGAAWRNRATQVGFLGERSQRYGTFFAFYGSDLLDLDLRTKRENGEMWIVQSIGSGIELKAWGSQAKWIESDSWSTRPTLKPTGDESAYHALLAGKQGNRTAAIGGRGGSLNLQSYGYRGDFSFAKLTSIRGAWDGLFLSLVNRSGHGTRSSGALLEAEWVRWSFDSRGHTELWPWTSGWVDLLGERRYFVLDSRGTMFRYHYARRFLIGKSSSLELHLQFLDIYPQGDLVHWRPTAFGLGVDDLHKLVLNVERAQAGVIGLTWSYSGEVYSFRYSATQIVPIHVWKRGEGSSQSGENKPRLKGGLKEYGGGFHKVTLSIRMGRLS